MIWYDDMMTWYDDMMIWYDDMIRWYDDMIWWYDMMIWWYDDMIWWYDDMIYLDLSWLILFLFGPGPAPPTHLFASCLVSLRGFFFPNKWRLFFLEMCFMCFRQKVSFGARIFTNLPTASLGALLEQDLRTR